MTRTLVALLPALLATQSLLAQHWLYDTELDAAGLSQVVNDRAAGGYLPVSLTGRYVGGTPRFAAVWQQNTVNVPWQVWVNHDQSGLGTQVATLGGQGYRLACLDSYGDAPNELYAQVYVQDQATFGAVTAVTRIHPNNLATAVANQQTLGREPIWLGGDGVDAAARLCGLFAAGSSNTAVTAQQNTTGFATWLDGEGAGGRSVLAMASYVTGGSPRFTGMSADYPAGVDMHFGVEPAELMPLFRWELNRHRVPVCIDAWDDNGATRYNVSWRRDTSNSKVFTVTGTVDPTMASLDTALQGYLTANDVRAAVMAVTRNGRLIHSVGYNYNRSGLLAAQPDSEGRVGSMSKPMTAIGIFRLIDQGRLSLNTRLGMIPGLDLSAWSSTPGTNCSTHALQITVGQLLQHTSGIGDSARINGNEATIAAATNNALPTDAKMFFDYVGTLSPFPDCPYAVQEYSNGGYAVLGRIIEAVTGESYEHWMVREVFGPVCAGRFRIGRSELGAQGPNELPYLDTIEPTYTTSVLGDGATVPHVYGGFNLPTSDSLGGWVTSAEAYARVLAALDNPSLSPISPAARTLMWSRDPVHTPTVDPYLAFGWWVNSTTGDIYHTGTIDGSFAVMMKRNDGINFVAILATDNPTPDPTPSNPGLITVINTALDAITTWPSPSFDLWSGSPCFATSGAGCGENTVPGVRLEPGTLPRIGTTASVEFYSLPTAAPFAFTLVNFTTAPIDLTPLGYPGCTMYPASPINRLVAASGGAAEWSLDLPPASWLVGLTIQIQAAALDPTATAPLTMSNLGTLHIGQ